MPANVILSWLVVYFFLPLSVLFTTLSRSQEKKVFSQHYKNVLPTQSQAEVCVWCSSGGMRMCVRDNMRG